MMYFVEYLDDNHTKHWITLDSITDVKFLMERFYGNVTILSAQRKIAVA